MGQQGELVTFGYNTVGQLTSVTSDDGTQYVASTTYNAQGQVTEQRLDSGANGFTRQSLYNPNTLRLETLKAGTSAPFENLQKLAYTYDLAGNVQTLTDAANSGQVQSFGYDWLDRLTSAATNAAGTGQYSHTYAYNAIGNITSYNGNAYAYTAGKPHAVTAAFGNAYGYDAVGNQTSRTIGGVAYTQTFDYDNRLVGVAGGSVSATFLYDAEGSRVKGTIGGVTTVYLAGLYEYQNGAVTKYYEGGAIRRTGYATDNGVFYVVSDHLRSTSVLVNRDGTVKSRNYYYPYGGNRGGSAFSGVTTKRFTGQYHEQGLPGGEGLSYYNARWYDAQVGVFISADTLVPSPLAPQTLNRYAYVRGNPLRYNDPTGHDVGCPGRDASACGGGRGQNYVYGVWPPAKKTWTWPSVTVSRKPAVVSRAQWGALSPGTRVPRSAQSTEGFYQRDTNPGGYAHYSELVPDRSLPDILTTIVIHHEGNGQSYDVRTVQREHLRRGWTDIGYHFVVGSTGTIYEGRDIGVRGAHVESANSGKIGVLLLGDFQPGPTIAFLGITFWSDRDDPGPTALQVQSTVNLIHWLDSEYGIDFVVGHRDVNATECPGDNALPFLPMFNAAAQEDRR